MANEAKVENTEALICSNDHYLINGRDVLLIYGNFVRNSWSNFSGGFINQRPKPITYDQKKAFLNLIKLRLILISRKLSPFNLIFLSLLTFL